MPESKSSASDSASSKSSAPSSSSSSAPRTSPMKGAAKNEDTELSMSPGGALKDASVALNPAPVPGVVKRGDHQTDEVETLQTLFTHAVALESGNFDATAVQGQILWKYDVKPSGLFTASGNTRVNELSKQFLFWKGDMVFKLLVSKTILLQTKLLIAFVPLARVADDDPTYVDLVGRPHKMFVNPDNDKFVDFTTPYVATRAMIPVGEATGVIYCMLAQPIVTSMDGSESKVQWTVFHETRPNFEFLQTRAPPLVGSSESPPDFDYTYTDLLVAWPTTASSSASGVSGLELYGTTIDGDSVVNPLTKFTGTGQTAFFGPTTTNIFLGGQVVISGSPIRGAPCFRRSVLLEDTTDKVGLRVYFDIEGNISAGIVADTTGGFTTGTATNMTKSDFPIRATTARLNSKKLVAQERELADMRDRMERMTDMLVKQGLFDTTDLVNDDGRWAEGSDSRGHESDLDVYIPHATPMGLTGSKTTGDCSDFVTVDKSDETPAEALKAALNRASLVSTDALDIPNVKHAPEYDGPDKRTRLGRMATLLCEQALSKPTDIEAALKRVSTVSDFSGDESDEQGYNSFELSDDSEYEISDEEDDNDAKLEDTVWFCHTCYNKHRGPTCRGLLHPELFEHSVNLRLKMRLSEYSKKVGGYFEIQCSDSYNIAVVRTDTDSVLLFKVKPIRGHTPSFCCN